ncbi:MAB_1171c family putative transporter [Actinoplanes sp. NPDC026619]|uniref:MAB_1171c family putative transporter n=1 Tax=Actinoplanes sp. NPDC026619 TaxID=3155798 RepID=UPI0034104851
MDFYSQLAVLEAANLIALWAVAIVRVPIAIRSSQSFISCLAIIVEALSMTIAHPPVGQAINRISGIANIETLLKHLLYVAFEGLIILALLIILDRDTKRNHAILWTCTGFTALTMIAGFSYDRETPNTFLLPERPGISVLFLYSLVYVLYTGGANIVGLVLFSRFGRRAESGVLRVSLRFLSASSAAGICYSALRASLLFDLMSPLLIVALLVTMYLGLLLCSTGSLLSALPEYSKLVWTYRSHRRLYPLWRDLTAATPGITLIKRRGFLRELSSGSLDLRFQRRVVEIRDGLIALRKHVPADIPPFALQFVENKIVSSDGVDAAADAIVLEVARRAKVLGQAAPDAIAGEPYRIKATGPSLFEEVQILSKLAVAYRHSYVEEFVHDYKLNEWPKSTRSGQIDAR